MRVAVLLALMLVITACGEVYSRDNFTKAVIGKSDQEVMQQFGKPGMVDAANPKRVVWTISAKPSTCTSRIAAIGG